MDTDAAERTDKPRTAATPPADPNADIAPFCGDLTGVQTRLSKLFTDGAWSYATNGHVGVRVPARPGSAPLPRTSIAFIFERYPCARYFPAPPIVFPPLEVEDEPCAECDGEGAGYHDCPECRCKCETCDGTGNEETDSDGGQFVAFPWAVYNRRYVRKIYALPGLELAAPKDKTSPMPFRFAGGGEGLLMPVGRAVGADDIRVEVPGWDGGA